MKVLLIEPRDMSIGLNVALGYLTASLIKNGIEVVGLSLSNLREYPPDHLERYMIERHKPDLIGVNVFYSSYYFVRDMVTRIKAYYNKPIIVGGPQMNIEGANILKDIPELDFAMVGESDHGLVKFCKTLESKGVLDQVNGLIWRNEKEEIIVNAPQPVIENLDELPFPSYKEFGVENIRIYTMMTSRGCPYNCYFCFRSTRSWRTRSPENMIEELHYARKHYGSKQFCIADDSCNLRPERIIKFCKLLKESGLNLPWHLTGARLDRMSDELIIAVRDAGCEKVGVGVETLQEDVFKNINKGETLDQIRDTIHRLKKRGLYTSGYFIIGLPGDTPAKTWDTYKQAKKLGLNDIFFTLLLPFPGTKMYDMIYNRPDVKRLRDYRECNIYWYYTPKHSVLHSPFEVPEYTEEEKVDMFHRVWVYEGIPKPRYHSSLFMLGLRAMGLILKYDPLHFPIRLWRLGKRVGTRMYRSSGRTPRYSEIIFRKDFFPSKEYLEKMYGLSQVPLD